MIRLALKVLKAVASADTRGHRRRRAGAAPSACMRGQQPGCAVTGRDQMRTSPNSVASNNSPTVDDHRLVCFAFWVVSAFATSVFG